MDVGMESRTQMKGLDLKMSRSYSSERGGKEKENDWKNRVLFLILDMKNVKR